MFVGGSLREEWGTRRIERARRREGEREAGNDVADLNREPPKDGVKERVAGGGRRRRRRVAPYLSCTPN
jgi:hypothetical protein